MCFLLWQKRILRFAFPVGSEELRRGNGAMRFSVRSFGYALFILEGIEMKKIFLAALLVLLLLSFSACGCNHQWKSATCEAPQTCELCGATEGDVAAHDWSDATCTSPKTCKTCNISEGEPIPHEWVAATCTEARTCFTCKLTEGEPNGHSMMDATCTEAETCSICGFSIGDSLGHILTDITQTREATCTETGINEGLCTRCNKTLSEEIPKLEHTPGEQTISVEATYDAAGTKVVSCTSCGTVLNEESYELTDEEKEAWYKKACEKLSYDTVARTPTDYIGRRVKITGEVNFIWEEADSEGSYSVYFVYTKKEYGFYFEDPYYVLVDNYGSNSRILEGDIITFYGELDGLYSEYGDNQPKLIVRYYDIVK